LTQYKNEMVSINGQFKMGRTEVTVGMWKEYCAATGKSMPATPPHGWTDTHPIVNVSQADCLEYATWAGLRLPSGDEWDLAATGGDGRNFPWGGYGPSYGDSPLASLRKYPGWDPDKCVNSSVINQSGPSSVASKPAGNSPFGCMDMAGNVWEWTTEVEPQRGYVAFRGGGWGTVYEFYFAMENNLFWATGPDVWRSEIGFRLAGPQ
jgi:formylglycine-generating enzyme required for sulfatase activity